MSGLERDELLRRLISALPTIPGNRDLPVLTQITDVAGRGWAVVEVSPSPAKFARMPVYRRTPRECETSDGHELWADAPSTGKCEACGVMLASSAGVRMVPVK